MQLAGDAQAFLGGPRAGFGFFRALGLGPVVRDGAAGDQGHEPAGHQEEREVVDVPPGPRADLASRDARHRRDDKQRGAADPPGRGGRVQRVREGQQHEAVRIGQRVVEGAAGEREPGDGQRVAAPEEEGGAAGDRQQPADGGVVRNVVAVAEHGEERAGEHRDGDRELRREPPQPGHTASLGGSAEFLPGVAGEGTGVARRSRGWPLRHRSRGRRRLRAHGRRRTAARSARPPAGCSARTAAVPSRAAWSAWKWVSTIRRSRRRPSSGAGRDLLTA